MKDFADLSASYGDSLGLPLLCSIYANLLKKGGTIKYPCNFEVLGT